MKSTINITNGSYLNNYLKEKYPNKVFIPFNEAMIEGNPDFPIFSQSFIKERLTAHQVELKDYLLNMNNFLVFSKQMHEYSSITLWFGNDMFCQLNLLTILAFFQQENLNHPIYLNLINENTYEMIKQVSIPNDDYELIYKKVFLEHQKVDCQFNELNHAIHDYFNYTNEMISFIQKNHHLSYDELFHLLQENTKKYGLGDTQIHKFIHYIRG